MRILYTLSVVGLGLASLVACGPDFQPRHSLQEIRLLTLEATPLEVGLNESVTVTPVVHVPEGRTVASYRWHYCPINLGAVGGYQCVNPACDVDIESTAFDAPVTLIPSDALFACIGILLEASEGSDTDAEEDAGTGIDPDTITKIDTALFYEVTDDEGRVFRSVKAIPLWKEKPEEINRAPSILDVVIDDVSVWDGSSAEAIREAKIEVSVSVDPESMDSYTDTRDEVVDEEAIISFYATAGSFSSDRKDGLEVTNTLAFGPENMNEEPWEPPLALAGDVSAIEIYVVVRDGRGGQTSAGPYTVNLTPAP